MVHAHPFFKINLIQVNVIALNDKSTSSLWNMKEKNELIPEGLSESVAHGQADTSKCLWKMFW